MSRHPPPEATGLGSAGRRPAGVTALILFFATGSLIAALSALALAFPESPLEPMWRLNPEGQAGLHRLGWWAVLLMATVSAACGAAAIGLAAGRRWGHRLAAGVLACNLLGDLGSALLRHDYRTLIGLPIGGAMLAYLVSPRLRARFPARPPQDR